MFTLYLRYTLDPNRIRAFRTYVSNELGVIRRSGCRSAEYYYPTDFAGPTNEAHGLIDFASLAEYQTYRATLGADPDHVTNVAALEASGAVLATQRAFVERVDHTPAATPENAARKQ